MAIRHRFIKVLNIAISGLAIATGHAVANSHQTAASPADSSAMTAAEVRKVDMDAKKITLRHGPIQNLDMPAMTMVFQVRDHAMLEQVKAGDKIRFTADKNDGAYRITRIEK
jgi:Cu(I)/Ag(I) efflux system protein CusF